MLLLLLFGACAFGVRYELLPYSPVANTKSQVVMGEVRVTVLTSRLFRVEVGPFEDRATLAVVNRFFSSSSVPSFSNSTSGETLTIETDFVSLSMVGSELNTIQVTSKTRAFQPWSFSQGVFCFVFFSLCKKKRIFESSDERKII
jgi:hypothetical protein